MRPQSHYHRWMAAKRKPRVSRRPRKSRSSRRSGSATSKGKLFIELGASPNYDYTPSDTRGRLQIAKYREPIHSLREGAVTAREFIRARGLGSGNWAGFGKIVDGRGRLIAKVSYNGRIWGPKDQEITSDHPRY